MPAHTWKNIVFEAMFQMGYVKEALARHEKRFGGMVNYPGFTTLFEGWGIGKEGFGGGTVNHAWSGGGLTVLSQYLCGIAPLTPAYKTFQVMPQPGPVKSAAATIASVAGKISSAFTNLPDKFTLTISAPTNTTAIVGIPDNGWRKILLGNKVVWENGDFKKHTAIAGVMDNNNTHIRFSVPAGEWHFTAVK